MGEDFSVRVDKWLWAVRIFKTRSDAAGCVPHEQGIDQRGFRKAFAGDQSRRYGDRKEDAGHLHIPRRGDGLFAATGKNVPDYVENLTSQAELDKLHIPKLTVFVQRDRGTGRPTKRERREIDSLMGEIYLDDDSETSGDSE